MIDGFYRCYTVLVSAQLDMNRLIQNKKVETKQKKWRKKIFKNETAGGIKMAPNKMFLSTFASHDLFSFSLFKPIIPSPLSLSLYFFFLTQTFVVHIVVLWLCIGIKFKGDKSTRKPRHIFHRIYVYILFESLMAKVLLPISHFCSCHYNNSRL